MRYSASASAAGSAGASSSPRQLQLHLRRRWRCGRPAVGQRLQQFRQLRGGHGLAGPLGQRPQPRQHLSQLLLDVARMPGQRLQHRQRRRLQRQLALQPGRVHAQRRELLSKFIVQLARQASPFVFLQGEHPLTQRAALRLGLVQRLRQVAQRLCHDLELAHGHRRQRGHELRVAALDASTLR